MKNAALLSLLCFTSLACPTTPPPVEPVPDTTTPDALAAPANPVAAAFSGREGAFAVTGEWISPEQPPMAFTATLQRWFGDDGVLYEVFDQPASADGSPGMGGWGKVWWDEVAGAAKMWWMDSMAPGLALEMGGSVAADHTITIEGVGPGQDGTPINYRSVYRLPEGQPDVLEMGEVLSDGTFVVMMRYTTTRTGDPVKTWNPPPPAPTPNEGGTGVEAPAPPDDDAPATGGSVATTGAESTLPAADALVVCHCLTYPNRTGGRTVAIKDCFATRGECANARAERLRRRGGGDPPVPACETESRPSCGQAVFGE